MAGMELIETVYEGKFLRVLRTGKWEYVERMRASGVVSILPLMADGRIILISQYRPAVKKNVIALPAGLAGDEGQANEDLLTAAKRELLEETGYVSRDWKFLTTGPTSSGLTSETISIFLARDAVRVGQVDSTQGEKIQVHEVLLRNLSPWLAEQERAGSLIDYKIFAALHLAQR